LIRKETYIPFLLSILLFVSIDISFYNHIVLGKENNDDDHSNEEDNDNRDSRDDDIIEKDRDGEDFEDISINELFDNDNNNRDSRDDDIIEKDDADEDVPFILPFNALPFP
jgi:hypothetical protein